MILYSLDIQGKSRLGLPQCPHCRGWGQSLIRELRPHMQQGTVKKNYKITTIFFFLMPFEKVKAKQWPDPELYRILSQDSSHLCGSGQGTPGASKIG